MRPKAVATFSATPSSGQSWRAISKVRAWRVSRLGEDLERLEAILKNLFLRRGPLAHRQRVPLGAAQKSPARAACTRRAAAHAEDGEGRRICLARNSALAEGEIRRAQPLLAERVGLKAAHNRGECAGDGLLLRPVIGARKEDLRNDWRAEPATPLPKDPDLLLPPDPDGPPVLPPFREGV